MKQFTLIPGKLSVDVFDHVIKTLEEPLPCWSYVSRGLSEIGQEEIVFAVKKQAEVKDPADYKILLKFIQAVFQHASGGRFLQVMDYSSLGEGAWLLNNPKFTCVFFTPEQRFEGVQYPDRFLTALIITDNEQQIVARQGGVRLMSILGKGNYFFPTTPWSDPLREDAADPESMANSALEKFSKFAIKGITVAQVPATIGPGNEKPERIVLSLYPHALEKLPALFTDDTKMMAFLCQPDPKADASLVWMPNQKGIQAIGLGTNARMISGNHILLMVNEKGTSAFPLEDGFAVSLTPQDWEAVRLAVTDGNPLYLPPHHGKMGLEIRPMSQAYGTPRTRE